MFNKELGEKVVGLETLVHAQGEVIASLVDTLNSGFALLDKQIQDNNAWLKEFHRLAIAEYTGSPKKRVYAFLYTNNINLQKNLIVTARDKFEDAQDSALRSLTEKENSDVSDWTMEAYKWLDISEASIAHVDKVEQVMSFEKPIDVYLHELELAKDRWAVGSEKKTMEKIIQKVRKQYTNKNEHSK